MSSTIQKTLYGICASLCPIAEEGALVEAELMLQHVLQCSRNDLYLHRGSFENALDFGKQSALEAIVKRRLAGEPLAYILGISHFYSLEITVTHDVLIPRPETEILVDVVLESEHSGICFYIDMGTGSGAVSAALSNERPQWRGIAADISFSALCCARLNCSAKKVKFICCNMLSAIKGIQEKNCLQKNTSAFDFIVTNPPYVSEDEMAQLDAGILMYEPRVALYGGKDGLDFYRILAKEGKKILKSGGRIYCEIGWSQGDNAVKIFLDEQWKDVKVFPDLAGRPRVLTAIHMYI